MALAFVPSPDRVFQPSGLCRLELVAAAEARWMLSVEKQSESKAREVRKLLKSRGVGLFARVKVGNGFASLACCKNGLV